MHSPERWEGHPSIPKRVFGPTEYLPSLIRKAPRFQDTGKLSQATKIGNFEATRLPCEQHDLKVQSMSAQFTTWFDSTFTNSYPLWKRKAIQASREAASIILMKAQQSKDHPPEMPDPCRPRTKPPCKTTQLEYQPEIQDICLITELEEDVPQTHDKDRT